jgi:hypothetical protein
MIFLPFQVQSKGKRYDFLDSLAMDNGGEQRRIQQVITASLVLMQADAMCEALGIESSTAFTSHGFGVYNAGAPVGIFLLAALSHQSGVWRDPHNGDWEVIDGNPIVFHGRPMPGFGIPESDALDLATDAAHHFMFSKQLKTANGNKVEFRRLSWAIFKNRTSPNDIAAKKMHDKAKADPRFSMVEVPDPANAERTRVDIELS